MGMDPRWPCIVFLLLHILFASVQQCEIPSGNAEAIRSLSAELLKVTTDLSKTPNPSIYLGLRLADDHSFTRESQYLKRLEEMFQPNTSSPPSEVQYQEQFGTGKLALYLLALRAACQNMKTVVGNQLITQVKIHLHKEMEQIGNESVGHPVTNYYQYGLGVLAMCVHSKKIDERVIGKLLHAEARGKFRHSQRISVDTEAMAGLAFSCLRQATFYTPQLVARLDQAVRSVKKKILWAQKSEGTFGNIYSSPLAMQFLIGTRMGHKEPKCTDGMATLLRSLERGVFQNSLIQSQLLPVLHGKSYLDVAGMECHTGTDSLDLGAPSPESRGPNQPRKRITVHLIVSHPPHPPLYKRLLKVPAGSSLLDILTAAMKLGQKPLSFKTENTLSGPQITTMMDLKAKKGEHKYWKVLRAPNTSLEQGIADYIPQDKETIFFRFVPW